MDAIEATGLTKRYGDRLAVGGVDLNVGAGEIIAILGPNGAGKTTLLEILEGHRRRDGGWAQVLGVDPGRPNAAWRARIGIVLQEQGVVDGLTVAEVLALYGGYYPRHRPAGELLALVGLDDRAGDRVDKLSGGSRRRLDLAIGLVGDPELVFLDEPTTGFDPDARRQAWSAIDGLRATGTTIVLTTHYLEEASTLADRVVVLRDGRVAADATPDDLARRAGPARVRFTVPSGARPPRLPAGARRDGAAVEIATSTPAKDLSQICGWAQANDCDLADLTVTRPSLEDVYLELIA
jgi:ABC-2 type transport system ATP-binding protein